MTSRILAHLKAAIRHPFAYVSSLVGWDRETDLERWQDPENLCESWDERTIMIAGMIPDGSAVIEFGAARLTLPKHLGPLCTYQPVDLVKRSPDTLAFDLNQSLPVLPRRYNYAVFSGVLEYVQDFDATFAWLRQYSDRVIFSYGVTDLLSDPVTRRRNGWINSYTDSEIRSMAQRSGLAIDAVERWDHQFIYSCHFNGPSS